MGRNIRKVNVDSNSNIFAAVGKTVKIFRCMSGNSEVKKSTRFHKMPSLVMDEHVHDIQVFDDGRRLFVANGNSVHICVLDKTKRSGLHFKKPMKGMNFHTKPILTVSVVENGTQCASAGDDGYICYGTQRCFLLLPSTTLARRSIVPQLCQHCTIVSLLLKRLCFLMYCVAALKTARSSFCQCHLRVRSLKKIFAGMASCCAQAPVTLVRAF